jgi:hypothetical protein
MDACAPVSGPGIRNRVPADKEKAIPSDTIVASATIRAMRSRRAAGV